MPNPTPQPGTLEDSIAVQLRTLWIAITMVAVTVTLVAALAAYGFSEADNATQQAAKAGRDEAALALRSTNAIKANRNSYILSSCRDQNRRHRNTIRYIHRFGVREAHRKHIRVRVAERQLQPFVRLEDAAIPHRSCRQALARARGH